MLNQTRLHAARLIPILHPPLRRIFPQVLWSGNSTGRQIALTYDDGPDLHDTPRILEVLARYQVHATFCVLGEKLEAWPQLAREIAAAGHQIGLHGYRHRPFVVEAPNALRAQLAYTRQLVATLCRRDPAEVRDVRPPYGLFTPASLRLLQTWGYRPMIGSVVPLHWLQPAERTVQEVTRQVAAGSLLVLHESLGGPSVAELTDAIVGRLLAAGYQFVTVDQMWQAMR